MKKIFYAIVAVAAITFSACNGTAKGGDDTDSVAADPVVAEAPEADADATITALSSALAANDAEQTQSLLQKAQEYIAKLQADGKLEEAKVYIAKLQQFISENEDRIAQFTAGNETLNSVVSGVKAIPVDAAALAGDAKDAVVGAANDAANAANDAANAAAQKATDAANNAVESGKKEAGKAIDNAAGAAKNALGL